MCLEYDCRWGLEAPQHAAGGGDRGAGGDEMRHPEDLGWEGGGPLVCYEYLGRERFIVVLSRGHEEGRIARLPVRRASGC